MADQRCGTCRWSRATFPGRLCMQCIHPIPESFDFVDVARMSVDDGKDCPCYQPQETTDDE